MLKKTMPYAMRKLPRKSLYRVFNTETKKIFAKATSKQKAQAQLRYLRGIEHGWKPRGLSKAKKSKRR